jgi:hypothetical protein
MPGRVLFTTPLQCVGRSDNESLVLKTKLLLSG